MSATNINFYSIQSSKGGVGKTTIALNLAKALQQVNSVSFIFDLDLCGTSISDMMKTETGEQLFGNINVTNLLGKKGGKGAPVDLLSAFLLYLGDGDDETQNPLKQIEKRVEALEIKSGYKKVVLLPSGTFSRSGLHSSSESQHLLFNEIHSGWFSEFIFQIAKAIEPAVGKDISDINIIFDNAPGWSALQPVIEAHLIAKYPGQYKFLFVSSPDEMDIQATVLRICDLYIEYLRKFYTLAKFEILKFKCHNQKDIPKEYKYLEGLEFYDKALFSEKVGTDSHDMTVLDLKKTVEDTQKEPQDFFHLIINKSAHVEAFRDQKIDLNDLDTTIGKILKEYTKEMLLTWKINNSKVKGHFKRINEVLKNIILVPFDVDLFFYYQNTFLSSYLDTRKADKSVGDVLIDIRSVDEKKDYLTDFGEVCLLDARLYLETTNALKEGFSFSKEDRNIFLHISRFSGAFHRLFGFLLKCHGDIETIPNFNNHIPRLLDAVTESIVNSYSKNLKDGSAYNELIRREMVPEAYEMLWGLGRSHNVEKANDYFSFLQKNFDVDDRFLRKISVQEALTILFVSFIYFQEKEPFEKTSYYYQLLPELFFLIEEKGTCEKEYDLVAGVHKELKVLLKTSPQKSLSWLELQYTVTSFHEAILSMKNLQNKHDCFLKVTEVIVPLCQDSCRLYLKSCV